MRVQTFLTSFSHCSDGVCLPVRVETCSTSLGLFYSRSGTCRVCPSVHLPSCRGYLTSAHQLFGDSCRGHLASEHLPLSRGCLKSVHLPPCRGGLTSAHLPPCRGLFDIAHLPSSESCQGHLTSAHLSSSLNVVCLPVKVRTLSIL